MKRHQEEQTMKHARAHVGWRTGLLALVVGMTPLAQAEDVTVTTYYPSPRGNYQTLSTTSSTTLATDLTESVVIGITPSTTTKLDV
ncbi:MAG: hypothetical protein HY353_03825, partial [Candidatus Omnitrophica bacterium]|nr:hypothetical protein [Candidatus Omnitrophota bacterium]